MGEVRAQLALSANQVSTFRVSVGDGVRQVWSEQCMTSTKQHQDEKVRYRMGGLSEAECGWPAMTEMGRLFMPRWAIQGPHPSGLSPGASPGRRPPGPNP